MSNSSASNYVFTSHAQNAGLPFAKEKLEEANLWTNKYLAELPSIFDSTVFHFYTTLNQRNLSGFVGEVYKHVLKALCKDFIPNPHPDGRPDILHLRNEEIRKYFKEKCFDPKTHAPIRDALAPFKYGGIEIKSTIGNTPKAGNFPVGQPRVATITGLNYWAHHAHACTLLGLYYDYCASTNSSPQIKGIVYCEIAESDWHKVSIGRPDRKKTSNTSLNQTGVKKLKAALVMHSSEAEYVRAFKRLGYI